MQPVPLIPYQDLIAIILTALGVMLAVLAIIIAVLAGFGYAGFKEAVKDAVEKQVSVAMAEKMKEYPQGPEIKELMDELKAQAALSSQIVEAPGKAAASKQGPQSAAETYPGEEAADAHND